MQGKQFHYNSEFESINTPNKAYLLGLYYSDGYVSYKPESCSYFSGIKLHKDDLKLLKNIVNVFPFFSLRKDGNAYVIRLNQKKACEDLIKNGVLPNKSSINKDKIKFPNINPKLYSHFIRGYFDGDGSIFFSRKNSNSKAATITGNNYFLIRKIKEILFYEGINTKLTYKRGGESVIREKKIVFKSIVFILTCTDKENIKLLSKYFYKNKFICMDRKYYKFIYWYNIKRPVLCPRCNSDKTFYMNKKNKLIGCHSCKRYSYLDNQYFDDLKPKYCKYCGSSKLVGNGLTRSRTDGAIISRLFLCRNCNRNESIKLTAPINSNINSKEDELLES